MDLDSIRILDLTRLLPGPWATQLFADLGADVVKIEPPGQGDYARTFPPLTEDGIGSLFVGVNRGKRSVVLDLKRAAGQEVFYELVETADVVFEGFRPGVTARLGVDYESVSAYNRDIIYCSLSGFGQTGPLSDAIGHDLTYEGYAGFLDMTREDEDSPPHLPGFPVADMAGGLFAGFSILGALLSRELGDGGGEYLDVSMLDALATFGQPLVDSATGDDPPRPGETDLTGALPWYDVYETADGQYVTFAALERPFWENFCAAVEREDLLDTHGTTDPAERSALREELATLFGSRTREEWTKTLGDVDAAVDPVLAFHETLEHPQITDRGLLRESGTHPRLGFPAIVDGTRPEAPGGLPELGEHTVEVLAETGISRSRIDELLEDGVLETPESE